MAILSKTGWKKGSTMPHPAALRWSLNASRISAMNGRRIVEEVNPLMQNPNHNCNRPDCRFNSSSQSSLHRLESIGLHPLSRYTPELKHRKNWWYLQWMPWQHLLSMQYSDIYNIISNNPISGCLHLCCNLWERSCGVSGCWWSPAWKRSWGREYPARGNGGYDGGGGVSERRQEGSLYVTSNPCHDAEAASCRYPTRSMSIMSRSNALRNFKL